MHLSRLDDLEPFTTLDGSTIREIAGPAWTPARNQSLAEATVPPGGRTAAHFHRRTEELYLFAVGPGDCAVIPPGTVHELVNEAAEPLVLLCCCAPAYSHEDTVLVGDSG